MNKKATIDPALGERIRARRKATGLTQADLASALGVSFQQVQKYEKGISAISRERLLQICHVMHLPPEFFTADGSMLIGKSAPSRAFELTGPQAARAMDLEEFLASGEGRRLVDSFMTIADPKLRTRILDFIAAVAADQ